MHRRGFIVQVDGMPLAPELLAIDWASRYSAGYISTNHDSVYAPMLAINRKPGYHQGEGRHAMSRDPENLDDTRATYDRVAREYEERVAGELAGKPLDRALLACFAEQVAGLGTVADVGCGPGHVAAHLHTLGVPMLGVDLSPEMVAVARRRSPEIPFEQGSILVLAESAGAWGGIVAFYSIIHLPPESRSQAFAEFFRVLRPGGLVLLAFHIGDEQRHVDEFFGEPVSLDVWFLQPGAIESQLRDVGFAIEMSLVRQPYAPEVEHQSQRAYILARKPAE